ncbi:MAG: twin-arginine translocation signal domain-containing protein, partial [Verrucomicrobiota bacterium]
MNRRTFIAATGTAAGMVATGASAVETGSKLTSGEIQADRDVKKAVEFMTQYTTALDIRQQSGSKRAYTVKAKLDMDKFMEHFHHGAELPFDTVSATGNHME